MVTAVPRHGKAADLAKGAEIQTGIASQPVKAMVRQGQFFKLQTALENHSSDEDLGRILSELERRGE